MQRGDWSIDLSGHTLLPDHLFSTWSIIGRMASACGEPPKGQRAANILSRDVRISLGFSNCLVYGSLLVSDEATSIPYGLQPLWPYSPQTYVLSTGSVQDKTLLYKFCFALLPFSNSHHFLTEVKSKPLLCGEQWIDFKADTNLGLWRLFVVEEWYSDIFTRVQTSGPDSALFCQEQGDVTVC